METIFAPWRLEYVATADERDRERCVFCDAYRSEDDEASLTLWRGRHSFALLNRYPYTSGHAMVAPIEHSADPGDLDDATLVEILRAARRTMAAIRSTYRPHGFNVGFNVGEAAGAGIEEHLHLHVVPRWRGDQNMMGVIGSTRVIPETLDRTFERLRARLADGEDSPE